MTSASIMSRNFKADPALLGKAIDWAIAENSRDGSPFYGKIDTSNVVMSGYSCGGTQALKYAGDPRVSSFVIMNSGIFPENYIPMEGMSLSKSLLDKITVPILYVTGGPEDVAYTVARDDFSRIHNAPVALYRHGCDACRNLCGAQWRKSLRKRSSTGWMADARRCRCCRLVRRRGLQALHRPEVDGGMA